MEAEAVVERDPSGTRQACRIDLGRVVIERRVHSCRRKRLRWVLTVAEREELARGMASALSTLRSVRTVVIAMGDQRMLQLVGATPLLKRANVAP